MGTQVSSAARWWRRGTATVDGSTLDSGCGDSCRLEQPERISYSPIS